jgi:hypothetical protein
MSNYRKLVEEALRKDKENKLNTPIGKVNRLDESLVYPDNLPERMNPILVDELVNQNTSLGKHPIFPEGDETSFEQKIMGDRFSEVAKRYKRAHDVDRVDNMTVMKTLMPMVNNTMEMESNNRQELEALAVKMVRDEYDIGEDVIEIRAELTSNVGIEGTISNPSPVSYEMTFKDHGEIVRAKDEVYKRRFVNAMIQGAAKKCNHMFHMVDDELTSINPRLVNQYSKLMSAADYIYYIIPKLENSVNGGVVRVEFPSKNNPKTIIHAQAMVFPVLVHELIKGVMEVLSANGLPKKEMGKFVISKADYLTAEPWDMRIGPALWGRFADMFDADDFKLKHHVWNELVRLPPKEFNEQMREIMAGTKKAKKIIKDIISEVRADLNTEDMNSQLDEISTQIDDNTEGYDWNELMGDDEDDEDGYDFDELFK